MPAKVAPFILLIALAAPAAAACRLPANLDVMARQTLAAMNAERQARGLPPVVADERLQAAAQAHACDSATRNRMGHDGSDGSDLGDRAARFGYSYREIAENVAQGHEGPATVTQGWMQSPGHRRNILMRRAADAGIGIAVGNRGDLHWVLKIGRE